MRTLVVMAVLAALLLSAGAAFAQYGGYGAGAAEKPSVRVKVGWFEPNESNLDGDLAFGLDYVVPYAAGETIKQPWDGYLTVDRLHAEDTAVEWTSWSVLLGVNLRAESRLYYGAGIGFSRSTRERTGLPDDDETNFAWEVGVGLKLGPTGFGEVKYRDGGEDGNKGVVAYVGVSY